MASGIVYEHGCTAQPLVMLVKNVVDGVVIHKGKNGNLRCGQGEGVHGDSDGDGVRHLHHRTTECIPRIRKHCDKVPLRDVHGDACAGASFLPVGHDWRIAVVDVRVDADSHRDTGNRDVGSVLFQQPAKSSNGSPVWVHYCQGERLRLGVDKSPCQQDEKTNK